MQTARNRHDTVFHASPVILVDVMDNPRAFHPRKAMLDDHERRRHQAAGVEEKWENIFVQSSCWLLQVAGLLTRNQKRE